jgi:peptide/nickel transport system substrate-binding protein
MMPNPSTSTWRERLNRRRLLSAAAAGGAALAAGCATQRTSKPPTSATTSSGQLTSGKPQPGGTFTTWLVTGNLPSLDPQQTPSAWTMDSAGAVMSRVLRFQTGPDPQTGQDRNVEGDLGLSVESPDGITWTAKLRPGVKFHNVPPVNGHAVESEDVKATFMRALDQPKNPYRGFLSGIIDPSQIETPAPDTVVFKLRYPYSPFRKTLASTNYGWIFPREAQAGAYDPAKQMIGSGPFLFDHFTPDVEIAFRKNPDWFETGRPYIDTLKYPVITDSAQQGAQFTGGHLDSLQPPANDVVTLKQRNPKAVDVVSHPGSLGILWFQLGDPASPWLDIRLRRALSMAIDREALGKSVFANDYDIAFNLGASFGKWALSMSDLPADTAQYYKYNPAEAKKLIEAAGVPNLTIKFGYPQPIPIVNLVQAVETVNSMLQAVGLKTTLVPLDYTSVFLNGGKGVRYGYVANDMIVYTGMEGANDVDDYMSNYFSSKSTSNEEHLSDAALDAMIAKARTVLNEDDRLKAYKDIQLYIADKMYTVAGLPQSRIHTLMQPWVRNFQYSATAGIAVESYAKVWIEK